MGKLKNKKARTGFTLPSTDITKVDREWRHVAVQDLQVGDIVADMGIVKTIEPTCRDTVYLEAGESVDGTIPLDTELFAFVKKEGN